MARYAEDKESNMPSAIIDGVRTSWYQSDEHDGLSELLANFNPEQVANLERRAERALHGPRYKRMPLAEAKE